MLRISVIKVNSFLSFIFPIVLNFLSIEELSFLQKTGVVKGGFISGYLAQVRRCRCPETQDDNNDTKNVTYIWRGKTDRLVRPPKEPSRPPITTYHII